MKELSLLFLGASKRVSLLERFLDAAARMEVVLHLYSCELDAGFHPISHLACVLQGPPFLAPEFIPWLEDVAIRYGINLMIPTMDAATVVLSRYAAGRLRTDSCWPVVSDPSICEAMYDKLSARELFVRAALPVPPDTPGRYPKIAKPRFGYGARGIKIMAAPADRQALEAGSESAQYVIEDFLSEVRETTVDFYVSPRQGFIGYVLRDRLEVSDGEVMVCKTRRPEANEIQLIEQVASLAGWTGCVTLQYLTDLEHRLYVLEINPRFGGGCTCAIEAGLDMPYYLMTEAMGIDFEPPARLKNLLMTRARRDFFYER